MKRRFLALPVVAAGFLLMQPVTQPVKAQNQTPQNGGKDWSEPFKLPVRIEARAQTLPAFGGGASAADSGEEKSFRILTVKHIPARGVAYLFQDADVISTEIFVMPAGRGQGGFGGGFGGGQGGFGGGNRGGFGGGFGGGQGGFGGGGFGGQGGGFGGGFGGNQGGFGGGGFGGGGFGGGGFGGGGFGNQGGGGFGRRF